jgi:hypothetical protein
VQSGKLWSRSFEVRIELRDENYYVTLSVTPGHFNGMQGVSMVFKDPTYRYTLRELERVYRHFDILGKGEDEVLLATDIGLEIAGYLWDFVKEQQAWMKGDSAAFKNRAAADFAATMASMDIDILCGSAAAIGRAAEAEPASFFGSAAGAGAAAGAAAVTLRPVDASLEPAVDVFALPASAGAMAGARRKLDVEELGAAGAGDPGPARKRRTKKQASWGGI